VEGNRLRRSGTVAEETVPTFNTFAAENSLRPRGVCSVCALPAAVREQLAIAREQGYGAKAMSRYLGSIGHDVPPNSVNNHLVREHEW